MRRNSSKVFQKKLVNLDVCRGNFWIPAGFCEGRKEVIQFVRTDQLSEFLMETYAFYILVTSMILNFIVLGISLNRPDSFFPVSLSAISIALQGYVLRLIALHSIS